VPKESSRTFTYLPLTFLTFLITNSTESHLLVQTYEKKQEKQEEIRFRCCKTYL